MFDSSERARFMGLYILGVITGPSIGSVGGGFIVQRSNWRWLFWILLMISAINTILGFFFLHESFAPVLLNRKKEKLEAESDSTKSYRFEGQDDKPLKARLLHSLKRPFLILSQPIVLVMSAYQALLFGTMYSIYTEMESIFSKGYGFSTEEVGLLYLGSGLGFVTAILILVPYIDVVHKALGKRHGIDPVPEFRLPLANIGALLVPTCLFIFFWTVQYKIHWVVPIMATYFYGLGQVMILNCTQNYFIDAFEQYAASAIAAATLLRMVVGGCAPLVSAVIFKKLGLGVGGSIYGGLALALSPAPLLFYKYGGAIREKYKVDL
jgi:MFS family permease